MLIKNDGSEAILQIPRNACISLQRMALENNMSSATLPYRYFSEELADGKVSANTNVYCVTRNPYDRIFSAYIYRNFQRDPQMRIFMRGGTPNERIIKRFEDFVLNGGLDYSIQNRRAYVPMVCFTQGIDASKLQLVKLEDQEPFKQVCATFFGFDPATYTIPHLRKSYGLPSYVQYYTREMLDKMNVLYNDDFNTFGYQKF